MAGMSNHVNAKPVGCNNHSNLNGSVVKSPLKLRHGWVFTSHINYWMELPIHARFSVRYESVHNQLRHWCRIYRRFVPWWRHEIETFPRYWPFVRGIHRSSVNSPHKGQWRRALMFPFICAWINGWGNNREACDLRRYRNHCDVMVMRLANKADFISEINFIAIWIERHAYFLKKFFLCPALSGHVCSYLVMLIRRHFQHNVIQLSRSTSN